MTTREDNPIKFRDNVYKSWRIMYSVVSQIKDVCYIAHLEPNPGVGYDCLSLLTKKPDKDLETNILLNRNGSNALINGIVLEKVWDRAKSDKEILLLAGELISRTKLQKIAIGESSQSTMTQIAKYVVDWLEEHKGSKFCVAPPYWPGGCRNLASEIPTSYNREKWPLGQQSPLLILGLNNREQVRLDMTDISLTSKKGTK